MSDEPETVAPTEDELASFRQWQRDNASPEAKELTEKGAKPTEVDGDSLLAQIQQLQAQMASMREAQGIPADPIEANVKALKDHVKLQTNANPGKDFSELQKTLDELPGKSSDLTTDDTDLVRSTVDDTVQANGHIAHELAYIRQLSQDLHREVLKGKKTQTAKTKVAA